MGGCNEKRICHSSAYLYIKRRHSFFVAHISVFFGPHRHISVSENHDVYNHCHNRGRRDLVTDLAQPCAGFIMCHHRHLREGLNHDDMMRARPGCISAVSSFESAAELRPSASSEFVRTRLVALETVLWIGSVSTDI